MAFGMWRLEKKQLRADLVSQRGLAVLDSIRATPRDCVGGQFFLSILWAKPHC
jgi:hypothetical protein